MQNPLIIQTITAAMEAVEKKDDSGSNKKIMAMEIIRAVLGDDEYDQYAYFISMFIDFAIDVSKGNVKLKLNKIKLCCF